VQEYRREHHESSKGPQLFSGDKEFELLKRRLREGVREVIKGVDAADSEKADDSAFGSRSPRADEAEYPRDWPDNEQKRQSDQRPLPRQRKEQAAGDGTPEQDEDRSHQEAFDDACISS
jgi:hypothetical protein